MVLHWLKKDLASDVAAVKAIGAGLATGRATSNRSMAALGLLAPLLAFVGETLSSGTREASSADQYDYIGDQWGTHGHNGPFKQWTED